MKKLLLSLAAVAAFSAAADEAVVLNMNDAKDFVGTHNEEKMKEDGSGVQEAENYKPIESLKVGDYLFTCVKGAGSSDVAFYYSTSTTEDSKKQATLRVYKNNEVTIAAPAGSFINKVELTLSQNVAGAFAATGNGYTAAQGASTKEWTLTYGGQNEVTFTPAANIRISIATITLGEQGEAPEEPTEGVSIYSGLVGNADDWTFDNVELPEPLTYIWKWDSYGYLKGSAFMSNVKYTAKSYAVSPVIDLEGYKNISVSFDQAARYQTSLQDLCKFGVRVEGTTEIIDLPITTWPASGAWSWANSGDFDLNAYAGKKIQLIFTYASSEDDGADTWEVKNVIVKGDKDAGVEGITVDENAPAEYYNLQGVRVAEPENGLYIVRRGNKVTKEVVR